MRECVSIGVCICVCFDRVHDFATTNVSHSYDRAYEYDCW